MLGEVEQDNGINLKKKKKRKKKVFEALGTFFSQYS